MIENNVFDLENYDYELPQNLIAQEPCIDAHKSKLLVCGIKGDELILKDSNFDEFVKNIQNDKVIFFNNSKVIKSRLKLADAEILKPDGQKQVLKSGEIFFLKKLDGSKFEALVTPGKKFKIGNKIIVDDYVFEVLEMTQEGRLLKSNKSNYLDFFEQKGQLPLPPYIQYKKEKEKYYQPIFAQNPGSLASPTACLHFHEDMLEDMKTKGINIEYTTLHIGLGTFKLVDVDDIRDYDIHKERVEVSKDIFKKIADYKNLGKKILAVGTTVTRTLESLPYVWKNYVSKNNDFDANTKIFWEKVVSKLADKEYIFDLSEDGDKISFETKLFIYPGYDINIIDELITNFHLPKSSLLMLVSAFMGDECLKKTYQYAIKKSYNFFSFGDAMRILCKAS